MDTWVYDYLTSGASHSERVTFMTSLWLIWKSRNLLISQGCSPHARTLIYEAELMHRIYMKWNPSPKIAESGPQREQTWSPLTRGYLKMNVDASWLSSEMQGFATGICRGSDGSIIGGFATKIHADSAFTVEALAVREALLWFKKKHDLGEVQGVRSLL
ncbi:hypothetical protein BT93_K1678 [Corymbia citriodora subsp. variegata]|nr:hypothetical protein BT93_K1678 [Corymbia citriodora subsp. variegata]